MKPTWVSQCGTVQLWLGSSQKVPIPSAAVAITDPPYNIGKPQLIQQFKDRKNGRVQETIGNDFGEDFDSSAAFPKDWIPFMPDTVATFYGGKRMETLLRSFRKAGYEVVQDFHWCKKNAPPPLRGVGFSWGTESGYLFRRQGTKHRVNKKAGYSPNFFISPLCFGPERTIHATQKPVVVMKWLVRFLTMPDALVVDPFMGAGSIGVACAELGRSFLGIEQREDYFELAVKRIKRGLARRCASFSTSQ